MRSFRITPDLSLEANGVDEETYNSLRFNVLLGVQNQSSS